MPAGMNCFGMFMGFTCKDGACGNCGGAGQGCCGFGNNMFCTGSQTVCTGGRNGMCAACGAAGQPCCNGDFCVMGKACMKGMCQ